MSQTTDFRPGAASPRTIVVTGGGSGIGRALALRCAKRGDNVAILDKNKEAAQRTAEMSNSGSVLGLSCDIRAEEQVEAAFDEVHRRFGFPYGLFANAGIDVGGLIHELPLETWHAILETNLTGVFLSCKYALRKMLAGGGGGSIVCTSSPTSLVALSAGGAGAYSASKAGISALVRCMAVDYARYGIRVNSIIPGATETALMWNNVAPENVPAMRAQIGSEVPLGRLALPEEPAEAVAWLLSDAASYVTGASLICDGGILAKASISV